MRALICGISGQDGAYLAQHLLLAGYEVVGTSRDSSTSRFGSLEKLGIHQQVKTTSMALNDFRSVLSTLERFEPDEIYNLAGQTSVGLSFDQPAETFDSIVGGTMNILEVIRFLRRPIRFYNAGSGECFGDNSEHGADEQSPFHPRSPYGVAKASAYWLVRNYRESYNIFACTGILFNHESPLRPARFVTQKIVRTAKRISLGSGEKLMLGNINIIRDWGWAPEYVVPMQLMLQKSSPDDFVIATGRSVSLEYFISRAFSRFSLDWRDHVVEDSSLLRPSDIAVGRGNPAKARDVLGWEPSIDVDGVIDRMCKDEF